jgi:hypothetical protein
MWPSPFVVRLVSHLLLLCGKGKREREEEVEKVFIYTLDFKGILRF